MLGVLPIQKPDAYIHFAPKERVELKYCVSISASKKGRVSARHFVLFEQVHCGFALKFGAQVTGSPQRLDVDYLEIFVGGAFTRSPYPQVFGVRPLTLRSFPGPFTISSGLHLGSDLAKLSNLIAPLGVFPVQLPFNAESQVPGSGTQIKWTYSGPTSLRGVSVYKLLAHGMTGGPQMGKTQFVSHFWLRISDSTVERIEMLLPPSSANAGGSTFVMTRIR